MKTIRLIVFIRTANSGYTVLLYKINNFPFHLIAGLVLQFYLGLKVF